MAVLKICILVLVLTGYYVSAQTKSYKCDFEQGSICSFLTNVKGNKENWRIGRGKLNAADTGPSVDHTTGTANGTYLFVNVSAAKTNEVSLQTVGIKKGYCVRFFYHMYGADIGSLTVSTQSVSQVSDTRRFFFRSRTQGDRWKEAFFTVTESGTMKLKGYRVIFTAKHNIASSVRGDIALDDIELTPGKCKDTKRDATQLCSFDDYDCGYSSSRIGSLNWEWKSENNAASYYQKAPSSDHTLGTSVGGYWILGEEGNFWSSLQTAILSSPVYKKPSTLQNCLHFYYYIEAQSTGAWMWGKVKEAYVQSFINYPNSKEGRMWLTTKAKNITNHGQWTYAEVKANITADFQFQFVAAIDTQTDIAIALDDIKLVTGSCPEAGFCDFEEDKCNWRDGSTYYNWVRKTGKSGTNSEIGPSMDNTRQTADGNYVVFSTKNKSPGSEANLESEFSPPNEKEVCLTFFYYMSGKDLGTLKVVRKEENVTESTLWLMSDDQGNMWKRGMAVLKPSILYNQVVFRGVTGKGSQGFMALDDIRIRAGEKCQLLPPEADPRFEAVARLACTFDDKNLCSWTQDKTTLSWKFGTGTSLDSTGPKQPVGGKGQYIYISSYEGTQSNNEKVARLQSAVITSFHPDAACFSFYYHMFGAHVGELRVVLVPMQDEKTPLGRQVIWRRRGTQPDKWLQFKDSLNVTEGDYRIEIEAEGGSGFAGDIAIDEIMLNLGACPGVELCDFESSLCGWTIEGSSQGRYSWQRGVKLPKGPSQDHTTMTDVGYYLQAVASDGVQVEEKTSLVSPQFDKRWGPHCVTFWYYRPGLSTGKISVLTRRSGKETLQWSAIKDVGKFWHYGQITIDEKKSLQLVFQAEKGPRNENDMALDDIEIKNSACGKTAECNFNNNYCSYFLNETSDFAWLLGTGRVVNTDFIDKTPADNSVENGMYIYTDMTSPSLKENQQAVLMSEILEVPFKAVSCLTYYYHLNGEDSSTLSVGKATLDNTEKDMKYILKEVYSTTDKTGGGWTQNSVDVDGNQGTSYQLYFKATRGKGNRAFIAVDDISIKEGPCKAPPTPTPAITTTEMPITSVTCNFDSNNFCSWKAESGKLKWKISDTKAIKDKMPKFDHTFGNYMGRYAYLQGDNIATKPGTLTSAQADQEWMGNFCVSFWYFMNVEGENSLELTAEHSSSWWSTDYVSFWKKEGNYGYKWRHAYVHVKSSKISPKLRIIGKVKTGVIALDDITAMGGSCPPSKMCTFDDNDDMCGYTQDSKNSVNWDVKSGEDNDTLTRMPDHTTNSIEGNYLYIGFKETPIGSSQSSRIYSPKHSPTDGKCVTFYYHIYNVSTLSLNTYLSTDNGLSDPQWSVTIGQGLLWHGARFTVASKSLSWQVVFEVNVGSRGYGQVAIDDILISNGVCPDQGYCDFETEDCLWENVRAPFDPNTRQFYAPNARRVALPQRADVNEDLLKDDMDWVRHIGEDYFGPARDHTLQSPQGFYLLLDPRSSTEGKKAVYVSERLRSFGGVCFKFWYSIPNYKVSSNLMLYATSDFKTANQVTIIGDNTNEVWTQSLVTVIPPMTSDSPVTDFWIFLAGITGNHTLGYIAIDDISVGDNACEAKDDAFDCKDGKHVRQTSVCDFRNDCLNGLDEANCATCDFESGQCGWISDNPYSYFRWLRSRAGREGLQFDHTKLDTSGYFMIAATTQYLGTAGLTTKLQTVDLRDAFSTCMLEFWYNIVSNIQLSVNLDRNNKTVQIWVPEGNSDQIWTRGEAFLGRIARKFKINFQAVRNRVDNAHVAVDDIVMKGCETSTTGDPGSCTSDQFNCKNSRCIPMDNICDYTDDCGNFQDESQEACATAISRCSFDQSFCNWISDNTTGAQWQLRGPFTTLDQGPTRDHTTGSSNGQFLYLPGRINNKVSARIIGPMLQPAQGCQIRLYFDIRGLGPLSLQIKTRTTLNGEEKVVWSREDATEGYFFTEDRYTFEEDRSFQVIIEGSMTITKGKTNYIALDDISFSHKCVPQITPLPTVPPELTTAQPVKRCSAKEFACKSKSQCIPIEQKCDFKADCSDGSDETQCGMCDFHEDMCGLVNTATWSVYQWKRVNAEAFSVLKNSTAPDSDSLGNKQGYFAVLTGKQYYQYNSDAVMRTPPLGATSHSCRLEFFYHYNIQGGGHLQVYVKSPGWYSAVLKFERKGTDATGKQWQFESVNLGNYPAGRMIEFHGNAMYPEVSGQVQDIAIDNINYVNCDPTQIYSDSLNCTFDHDECGWHPDNDITAVTWTRAKKSPQNYGTQTDHTGRNGYFMYISASWMYRKGQKAHLVSLKQNATDKRCFNFWYHMYGEDVGTLNLIIRTDTGNTTIWSKTNSQGNAWKQGTRTIRSEEPYQIVIEGVIGGYARPVMAIDDIEIYEDECPHPVACDFEADFCEWTSKGFILQLGKSNIPAIDHTTDTETGRYAALTEETGTLTSPDYNYTSNSYCVNFWYFLEGDRNAGLKIQRVEQTNPDNLAILWADIADPRLKGQWMHSRTSVTDLSSGDFNVVILGHKSNLSNAVAVDDVAIEDGACPPAGSCNFERDFCTWRNLPKPYSSGLQWLRNSGSIVNTNTGPKTDHTTGTTDGWYIYMDGNYGSIGNTAVLESEILHYSPNACLKYWYHQYGWGSGSLQVKYVNHSDDKIYDIMTIPGSQGNNWYPVKRLVKDLPPTYKIRFIGVKGRGGDLALDDIFIQQDTCDEPTTTLPPPTEFPPTDWDCDFEVDFCNWINGDGWTVQDGRKALVNKKGPTSDHTRGNALGRYAYYDPVNGTDDLISPTISTENSDYCFRFWYYMHSIAPISLEIHALQYGQPAGPLWTKKTSADTNWKYGTYFFEKSINMSVIFRPSRSKLGIGDIAVDDLTFNEGRCPVMKGQPCDFEAADICGFKLESPYGIAWKRTQAKSIKGKVVGPKVDKSYGTSEGHYMIVRPTTAAKSVGDNKAYLVMPNVPSTGVSKSCVRFWYQMSGENVLSLNLYMRTSGGALPPFSLWSHSTKHGDNTWRVGQRTIDAPYTHEILFEAVLERGDKGFIALDEVVVREGACPSPGSCDFESDLCTWQNAESGVDIEWVRNSGPTPTNNTGPDVDHTLGTELGSYIYLQAENPAGKHNLVGILQSEYFSLSTERCLSFWAHMSGKEMGSLQVNMTYYDEDKVKTLNDKAWKIEGDKGNKWFNRQININIDGLEIQEEYQILFIGKTKGALSDIALDDIEVTNEKCYEVPHDAFDCRDGSHVNASKVCDFELDCPSGEDEYDCGECDFEHGDCGWRETSSSWYQKWIRVQGEEDGKVQGPGYDHTFNTSKGHFMLVDSRSYYSWQESKLESDEKKLKKSYASCIVNFYFYHMSKSKASIRLRKRIGTSTLATVWERIGMLDEGWQKGTAYLGTTEQPFTLEFVHQSSYEQTYVAIDDITYQNCSMPLENDRCRSKEFACGNGRCVSRYFLCDQTDDCGDRSDEDARLCASYPKPCTFEVEGDCEWTVQGKARNKWYTMSASSSRMYGSNTGPIVDHTKGIDAVGKYLMIKRYYDDNKYPSSYYHSPNYQVSGESYCSLRFYYYMHGAEDQTLKVYTETEKDGWNWKERFSEAGSFGQKWNRGVVNVRSSTPYHYIIEGNPGNVTSNIIAIDDISLSKGCKRYTDDLPTPLPTPLPTKSPCKDSEFKCITGQPLCIPKTKVCDFTADCADKSDEKKCGPCSFEEDFCGWQNESPGTYEWKRKVASDDEDGYGPKTDHLNSTTGSFAYVTEGWGYYSDPASLASPPLPMTSSHCVMSFWLNVNPSNAGSFYVQHKSANSYWGNYAKLWTMPSTIEKGWQQIEIKIPETSNKGTVVKFSSAPNWGFWARGDKIVAIDEIEFINCNPKELLVDCDFDDETFHDGFCFWKQPSINAAKWKRTKGTTQTNFTGPTSDHTTGHGYYLYSDYSNGGYYSTAQINSPVLPMNSPEGSCFTFWYHMYGQHIRTLAIDASGYWTWSRLWTRERNQGNQWKFGEVEIKSAKDYTIRISAFSSWGGTENIIAMDDFKMVDGPCPRTAYCDFEQDLCGWNATFDGLAGWNRTQGSGNWSDEKPNVDHTTNSEFGYFIYMPYRRRGDLARLESPLYDNYGDMCVKFWYNMFGNDIGSLAVYQRTTQEGRLENLKSLWKKSGDHAGGWKLGRVTMKSLPNFYIAIEAQTGEGPIGYIALDDIHVTHGACSDPGSCTFEIDTCGWTNADAFADVDWIRRTGLDRTTGKGPAVDHSTATAQGHYMYALLTGLKAESRSMLASEDLEIAPNYCLSFWYNMFNTVNSSLLVEQSIVGEGWVDQIEIKSSDAISDNWVKIQTNITVPDAGDFFQIGLTAFTSSAQDNDTHRGIAIDDLSLIKSVCGKETPTTISPPTTTTEYPPSKFDCTFEVDYCLWENDPDQKEVKWLIVTGHSDKTLTRPRTDHSTLSTSGHYITLNDETKKNYFARARLLSQDGFDPNSGVCFKFWYHMYGNSPGSLYVKTQNFHDEDKTETIWYRTKSQGPNWKYGQVYIIKDYFFKIVMEGDGSFYGDISLDDFSLNEGECPSQDFCDVEHDYCGFTHDPESDFQWKRGNGSRTNGPDVDHTYGTSQGNYFYLDPIEAKTKGKVARLESSLYKPDKKCMQFWYYLYGIDVGTLEVLLRNGDTKISKWKEVGDNTQYWHPSEIVIDQQLPIDYSYIFQVTTGSAFSSGKIALDDITIKTECPSFGSCNFEEDMCLWVNDPDADLSWMRGTGEITEAGPETDVTFGNQFGTYLYAHIVNTWNANPKPARLMSPYFPAAEKRCVNYWNFRNGTSFDGALTVSMYNDVEDEITELQFFTQEKLGRWNNEQFEIDEEGEGKYQIIFEAQLTTTKNTFIALDDITVYEGECQPIEDRKPDFTCEDGENHISDDFRCDFYNDCKDGSDEKDCGTSCDFEADEPQPCNWKSRSTNDQASWNRTLANYTENPDIDHTKGVSGEGYYMKVNILQRWLYKAEAHFNSPLLIQSSASCRMFFWYYFYGLWDTEALYVYFDSGHQTTNTEIFRLEGDHEKSWRRAEVIIGRIQNRFRVGIVGKKESATGVIAIDDLEFENCYIPRTAEPQECKEDQYLCQNGNCIPKDLLCDFVDDCGDYSDENRLLAKCDLYPGRCDFEGGNYCGWSKAAETDYNWQITKPNPTAWYNKVVVTRDHTRNSVNGQLLYFGNSNVRGTVARMASKVMEAADSSCKFRFFYTYGTIYNSTKYDEMKDIGTLTVYARRDEINVWKVIFTTREPPGQFYEKVTLPLGDIKEPFEIIVETRVGREKPFGGWAVDDVSFTSGCVVSNKTLPLSIIDPTEEPEEKCNADQFLCKADKRCIDIDKVCDFVGDCSDSADEAKCGTCNFDDDSNPTCGWRNSIGRRWVRRKGQTGSNGLTSDVSGSGYYMYVNKDNTGTISSSSYLRSVDFKQAAASCEISFYYFMSGITDDEVSLKLQLQTKDRRDVMLWEEVSDQGRKWQNATVSINRRESGWHLDFIALHALSKGDIAIDEIKFLDCAPPEKKKCTFDKEFMCGSGECINSSLVCDFSEDCPDSSDEVNCTDYLERCDFEKDWCTWTQDLKADLLWKRTSGGQLAEGTGPDRDHTKGDETGHFLMVTRDSYYYIWKNPKLISTPFMADVSGKCKLRFWYHLYSSYTSKISVQVQEADGLKSIELDKFYGSSGDEWQRAEVPLTNKFNFHAVIEGFPASGRKGELAIDDISFTPDCIPVYTVITTPIPTIQPKGICEKRGQFTCEDNSCLPMEAVCDFKTDCPLGLDEKDCPALCDFEFGTKCGWQPLTRKGDGVEINVTTAEDGKNISPDAPKVDKTTNTSKGSYLVIHTSLETKTGPVDEFRSPVFSRCASPCKFTVWYVLKSTWFKPVISVVAGDELTNMVNMVPSNTWKLETFGIGRQDNFSISFNKKGAFYRSDFLAVDDIEFINCALPKKSDDICMGFRCKTTRACIDDSRICDLTDDCGDATDEAGCADKQFITVDFENNTYGIFKPFKDEAAPLTWDIKKGMTPSHAAARVGPPYDHTLSNKDGRYISMSKGLSGGLNERARLISDVMYSVAKGECQMRFYYFMFGQNVNQLNIYTIVKDKSAKEYNRIWRQTGEVGNFWMRGTVGLNDTVPFQIIIEGKAGINNDVIAMDDISFSQGCKLHSDVTLPPKEVTDTTPSTGSDKPVTGSDKPVTGSDKPVTGSSIPPTTSTPCLPTEFFCVKDKKCIAGEKRCDFRNDCKDGSDEADCVKDYCNFENREMCGWEIFHKNKKQTRVKRAADDDDEHDAVFKWMPIQANDTHTEINWDFRPKVDHTTNSSTGWYLLADGAPGRRGDVTSLTSPLISLTHAQCALDFWLYCGRWSCELSVHSQQDGTGSQKIWDAFSDLYGRGYSQVWTRARAPLSALKNFRVRFDAQRPYTHQSAVCLDDISFLECAPPKAVDPQVDVCDSDEFMCGNGRCIQRNLLCDFTDDCGDYSDERDFQCQDYRARCNFDTDLCRIWTLENHQYAKWLVRSGSASLFSNIPREDHTTRKSTGKFLNVNSGGFLVKNAKPKVRSPTIEGTSENCTVRFYFNSIYAADNSVRLYKRHSYTDPKGYEFLKEFTSDVTSYWHRAEHTIVNTKQKDYQIVLEAGLSSKHGSLNIDDISLTPECHLATDKEIPGKPTVPPTIDECYEQGKLTCKNGNCYTHLQRCNFINDCGDNTDEKDCGTSCDFEKGTCGWYNPDMYRGKWVVASGKNYYWSKLDKDHTFGNSSGHYIKPTGMLQQGDVAQFHTQNYVASGPNCKMSFWYFRESSGGALLRVLSENNVQKDKFEVRFKVEKDGDAKWINGVATFPSKSHFSVVIEVIFGSGYLSSMAIDDIEFQNCRPDEPPVECGLQEVMCKDQKKCIQEWERCDGKPDCYDGSDEVKCPRIHGDCHFDDDWPEKCDWQTKDLLQFEWTRASKPRNSETGPPSSRNKTGSFLFMDSSKAEEGDRAGVQTPVFKPNDGNCHLRFWYYMHGSTAMGTLLVLSEGEDGQSFPVFTKKGPQGQQWNYAHKVIGNDQHFRVTFMGIRGGDDKSDIAIDDVVFTDGCEKGGQPPRPTGPPTFCFKDDFVCRTGKQCIPSNWRCDCAYDCQDGSDEDNCDTKCTSTSPPKFVSTTTKILPSTPKKPSTTTTRTSPTTTMAPCPEKSWRCDDGLACIPRLMLCDGVEDCKDGSDEKNKCKDSNLCTEMKYFCMDRKTDPCLPRNKICNGKSECSDGSDESLCDRCPPNFCLNGGECKVVNHVPVCTCKEGYAQNRCKNKKVIPKEEEKPKLPTKGAGVEWIIGVVIGTILLIAILFVIWYKRNTNAERARLPHAVDNPVYGLNLDTLTFGELNSHMPVRTEDGAGATAIENPLYAFKSEIK